MSIIHIKLIQAIVVLSLVWIVHSYLFRALGNGKLASFMLGFFVVLTVIIVSIIYEAIL